VLLADEPTGNLDSERSKDIMKLLQSLNQSRGITIIMVTHEAEMAKFASRIITFADGKVAQDRQKVLA
jgi:putative ABC transport system ATP-binding protein